ncbi:MAG TPA: phosphatidylglycerophosphatase A [Polyangiaceae bacterium]
MAHDAKTKAAYVLGTWFGCGKVPIAPGTAGTAGAIPLYLLLRPYGLWTIALAAFVCTFVGVWAANIVCDDSKLEDPQLVVIDEVAGVLITLLVAPFDWKGILAAFVLFRVFDQFKPFPARRAEDWPRGWGVMFDDVFAGIWGAAVLALLVHFRIVT